MLVVKHSLWHIVLRGLNEGKDGDFSKQVGRGSI